MRLFRAYVQGMSRRAIPIRHMSAAAAALLTAACASPELAQRVPMEHVTWAGYLYGEDLRQACGGEGADRFRLVFNADAPGGQASIFEVAGHPDRGGYIEAWQPGMGNVAELRPGAPVPPGSARQRLDLTGEQYLALALRLLQAGALAPPDSQLDLGGSQLRWFATGCLDGRYFLSAYVHQPGTVADISWQVPGSVALP